MPAKTVRLISVLVLAVLVVGTLYATDVLVPGENPPERVVMVRKLAMRSNAGSLGSLRGRLEAEDFEGMVADARSLASVATFLPLVFQETYEEVYPVEGSNFYFRGAPEGAIAEHAAEFNAAAEQVISLADEAGRLGAAAVDISELEAAVGAVGAACASCHGEYRGQN